MDKTVRKKIIFGAICLFTAAAALIRLDSVLSFLGKLCALFIPVLLGFLLAAVLNDPVMKTEKRIKGRFPKLSGSAARRISIALVYLGVIAVIALAVAFIIPQLADSVRLFVNSFDGYYSNFLRFIGRLESMEGFTAAKWLGTAVDYILEFIKVNVPRIAEKAYDITSSAVMAVTNGVFAAVISVYLLADKERFISAAARILAAFLSEEKICAAGHYAGMVTGCFSRFIHGQLTEAVLLGGLCFLGMILFGFDYPLLISAVIGITALVPVVGAFIGTVPSALMLFLIEPSQALWFTVFILILQQLENNLIYPKVVGKSIGLPPPVILIAIIFGAGLGGTVGILIGIPSASVIYLIVRERLNERESAAK
ncbi:MAG: AI-2E family transporter [Oscillospiraceae bacterium]|nr:AI-2E family transporter [Oscillospiraceae bacterium]